MRNKTDIFINGIIKQNPVWVLLLGTCPTLATTTTAYSALGMGFSMLVVLVCSNIVISIVRNLIPNIVRIPAFIVIIAGFVTVISLVVEGFLPKLYKSLGIFLPLIVVNCIILARAEAFASKNKVIDSFLDGLGMGLGFTVALFVLGSFRELLGNGTLFGVRILPDDIKLSIFSTPSGGFLAFAFMIALMSTKIKEGCSECNGCNRG